jgi:hypothetical protein
MLTRASIQRPFSLLLLAVAMVDCSGVLGIQDAQCDPNLPECQGTSALCTTYCSRIMAACKAKVAQYTSLRNCQAVCDRLPAGLPGDQKINTVQCRLAQVQLAEDLSGVDQSTSCVAAGPGGNGICGSNCEGVCAIIRQSCTGDDAQYGGDADICIRDCSAVRDEMTFNTTDADKSEGNSQQCRLWHANAAAQAPFPHCRHAAGASPCN